MLARTICSEFLFFYLRCAFFLHETFFLVQLAGGFDEIITSLGYDPVMVKREVSTAQQKQLLLEPLNRDADLTKAARGHSRRLAHASRSMARSMLGQRNSMVVSCPCSPGVQFTVYGAMEERREWPHFQVQCHQGCGANRQQWNPVHRWLVVVETFCNGGFTCVEVGEWDDSTAAGLAEQKVRVSLHTMHFAP